MKPWDYVTIGYLTLWALTAIAYYHLYDSEKGNAEDLEEAMQDDEFRQLNKYVNAGSIRFAFIIQHMYQAIWSGFLWPESIFYLKRNYEDLLK